MIVNLKERREKKQKNREKAVRILDYLEVAHLELEKLIDRTATVRLGNSYMREACEIAGQKDDARRLGIKAETILEEYKLEEEKLRSSIEGFLKELNQLIEGF
jgi:hypothetical protein